MHITFKNRLYHMMTDLRNICQTDCTVQLRNESDSRPTFLYFEFLRCLFYKLKGSCKFWPTRASFVCEIVLHCTAKLRAHCF